MSITLSTKSDLECLTNELFLDIFAYLNTSQIYHAFRGLNGRLDAVILEYFRTCRINFQSVSKVDFDIILQDHLATMVHQITSLGLSDSDDTPGQIDQFFASGFSLSRFANLRSLCLDNVRSQRLMNQIMLDLPSLQFLVRLTLKQCYYPSSSPSDANERLDFGNAIWSLPKLEYCCFKVDYKYRQSHHFVDRYRRDQSIALLSNVTSSTLKCLSITGFDQCDFSLDHLLEHSPSLQSLSIDRWWRVTIITSATVPSITRLSISLIHRQDVYSFMQQLRRLPNLVHLKTEFPYVRWMASGIQWEQLISNHLPQLQRLEFRMPSQISRDSPQTRAVDECLDSFRSPFWLRIHRWYVQCDWTPGREEAVLYTLPYAFEHLQIFHSMQSKSTHPDDDHRSSYQHVQHLMYQPRFSDIQPMPQVQFHQIQHLSIQLPVTNSFWTLVPTFDHLVSLDVLSEDHDDQCQQQLQHLLDRAPRLSSIRISWQSLTSSLMQLFNSQHLSVYHLELLWYKGRFSKEQCVVLDSILPGIHCSVLSLNISGLNCVLELIKTMRHLRALNVEYSQQRMKSQGDSICQRVREQISPMIPNVLVSQQDGRVRLWLC